MTVLYLTQEYAPFFADGGLGVTSAALPAALARHHGVEHDIVLPYYPALVRRAGLRTAAVATLPVRELGGVRSAATVHRLCHDDGTGNRVYLVRADAWYDRPGIYRDERYRAFADEAERATYFGWCVADWVSSGVREYVLAHGNDWQSGPALSLLRQRFPHLPALLTVHNGQYRGGADDLLTLAAGAADTAVTCSAAYAAELLAGAPGDPLPAALRRIGLTGVALGVDPAVWDPAATGRVSVPFDAAGVVEGKRANRRALADRLGLHGPGSVPLVGVCSRLVPEKGTDLLLAALAPLVRADRLRLVLVGPATGAIADALSALAGELPGRLAHVPRFDQDLAWLTYAGADLTVMPSRVEPGGQNQLIAYRYGTLPVVSPVGGLGETVTDLRARPATGTGFHIAEHTAPSVGAAVRAALDWLAADEARATAARRRVMALDWSWASTAREYAAVHARLLGSGALVPGGAR